eukprot:SAG25_NODE_728_length_5697_cov_2.400322_5_plen_59_part_00
MCSCVCVHMAPLIFWLRHDGSGQRQRVWVPAARRGLAHMHAGRRIISARAAGCAGARR